MNAAEKETGPVGVPPYAPEGGLTDGLGDSAFSDPRVNARAALPMPTNSVGGLRPGGEADPVTEELPRVHEGDTDVLSMESARQTPAERRGAAREAARRSRQEKAAAKLAYSKQHGFRTEPVRTMVRGIGQLFITLGVVLLLFVVYEVYVTDFFGAQKQAAARETMQDQWGAQNPTVELPPASVPPDDVPPPAEQVVDPAERVRTYDTEIGAGFANLFIPVFGADYVFTVVEGTTQEDLYGNPGHYDETQYPGELGNFAVAGHRVSKGAPFNALGTLESCDAIVIETRDDWFVYRVLPMADEVAGWDSARRPACAQVAPLGGSYTGVHGREITVPSDYAQVLPIPHVNDAAALPLATERLITLTTCHPQFSDRERMIIHAVLVTSYAKAPGFLPPELGEA